MRKIAGIYMLLLGLLPVWSLAQNVEFHPRNFKKNKEGLTIARKAIAEGDKMMKLAEDNDASYFRDAYYLYREAWKVNPNNAALNTRLSTCLYRMGRIAEAMPLLLHASEFSEKPHPLLSFYLAEAYLETGHPDKAKEWYLLFRRSYHAHDPVDYLGIAVKRIQQCNQALEAMTHPSRFILEALEMPAGYESYNAWQLGYSCLKNVLVTGCVNDTVTIGTRLKPRRIHHFQSFYTGAVETLGDMYVDSLLSGGYFAVVNISNDGNDLILTDTAGTFYAYHLMAGSEGLKVFPASVNSGHHLAYACYSWDGKLVYFSSDRPGGSGGYDIYVWDGNEALNLGPNINSPDDELGVFSSPDGSSLYFTSNGWNSIGGYDIFLSRDGGTPVNLGYGVNSTGDEYNLWMMPSGREMWVTGRRFHEDRYVQVWKMQLLGSPKIPVQVALYKPYLDAPDVIQVPVVKDEGCSACGKVAEVHGHFYCENNCGDITVNLWHSTTGEYLFTTAYRTPEMHFSFPYGKPVTMEVRSPRYLPLVIYIPADSTRRFLRMNLEDSLQPVKEGHFTLLSSVTFSPGSEEPSLLSVSELRVWAGFLRENPGVQVSLGWIGSTDKRKNEKRLNAVKKFWSLAGVDPERVKIVSTAPNEVKKRMSAVRGEKIYLYIRSSGS